MLDVLHLYMNFPVEQHGRHIPGMPAGREWRSTRVPYRSREAVAEELDASAERAGDRRPDLASTYRQIAAAIRDGHDEGLVGGVGWRIEVFWSARGK